MIGIHAYMYMHICTHTHTAIKEKKLQATVSKDL